MSDRTVTRSRRRPALAAVAALLPVVASLLPAALGAQHSAEPPAADPTMDEMRAAAQRFRDVEVAVAEGYIPDPTGMCMRAEMAGHPASDGSMGLHYFHPGMLGITATSPRVAGTGTHTDFRRPAILLYEPQADGSLELVGVENLVFRDAWRAAGHVEPPSLGGRTWDLMEDDPATELDEAHGFEPHYDQHVWLFRDHPTDPLTPFNPAVTCEHAPMAHGTQAGTKPRG